MYATYSNDAKDILEALNLAIEVGAPLVLQRRDGAAVRTRAYGIQQHKRQTFVLLGKPLGIESCAGIERALFKLSGMPILSFEVLVVRETEKLIATPLPGQLLRLELRQHPRVSAPEGSMATFFLGSKPRASMCLLKNISKGGVSLIGKPIYDIRQNDVLSPCTLSFAGNRSLIVRELTVKRARIVRAAPLEGDGNRLDIGLCFDLNEAEEKVVIRQLETLTRELAAF